MNQSQIIVHDYRGVVGNTPATISSLEVSEMVGRDHKEVLRDIRNIASHLAESKIALGDYFKESTYTDANNQSRPCFLLTKKGCELYGTRMTGVKGTQFAVQYIERFNEMEQHIQQMPTDPIELALHTALETHRSMKQIETDVNYLKNSMRIDGIQQKAIQTAAKKQAMDALGGSETKAYKDLSSKVFRAIWKEFNNYFGLPRYGELPKSKYDDAMYFISQWRPDTALRIEIEACNKQAQFKLVE